MLTRRSLLTQCAALPMAVLTACSLGGGAPIRHFGLQPLRNGDPSGPDWSIAVATPRALQSLDTPRIATRPGPLERQYYQDADWEDRAPRMLQWLIIRSLQNCSRLKVSADDQPGPLPDFLLTANLQDFQSETGSGAPTAHITLIASLARGARREILATRRFEAISPIQGSGMPAVIGAFDVAFAEVMPGLLAWIGETGNKTAT